MVIWGWLSRPILLGMKTDLCSSCKQVGPHAIVRQTRWAHVFWIPVLPFWIGHRLSCMNCGAQQKLGIRQVRAGLKAGSLPLGPRPEFKDYSRQVFEDTGRTPRESEFDKVEVNPKRGPWDLWLKTWPVVTIGLVLAVIIFSSRGATVAPTPSGPIIEAHTCWVATDGSLAGCRMNSGTVEGVTTGKETVCFFAEPMPSGSIRCRD
jgi:hypothetical protein